MSKAAAKYDANKFKPVQEPAASRLSLRERALQRRNIREELVEIEHEGEILKFLVVAPPSGVKWEIEQHGFSPLTGGILPVPAYPALIIGTVCDPESREKLFAEGDEAIVGQMDPDITTPLVRTALRIAFPKAATEAEGEEREDPVGKASRVPAADGSGAASPSPTS